MNDWSTAQQRVGWYCYCPPPHNKRNGPGMCLTCGRFPYTKSEQEARARQLEKTSAR